jgi:Domain of unknown function (DUF4175)
MKHQDALAQLARETKRARRNLALERSIRVGFWFVLAIVGWAAFALSGLHEALPLFVQSVTAILALAGFAWLGWRVHGAYRQPTEAEARARLAADSQLDSGAFESLRDRPSRFDPFSVALWRREQEQAYARVERAHAAPARPKLDDIDGYKLRYIALAALLIAGVIAGGESSDRLARAFLPDPGPLVGDGPLAIEAWATPADYTHAPPVSLSDRVGERIETPPTVEATVRVTGPRGAPRLVFEGRGERRSMRFTRAADGAWEAHLALPGPGRLKIVRFHTRAAWRIAPAPDAAPSALFAAPPAVLPEERVTLGWSAEDDYGIARLALRVRPVDPPEGLSRADPIDTPIETPAGEPRNGEGEAELEMASHPYAGMEVEARIVAFDALGQVGESAPQRFTLPEKVFLQPLARAAIEIRRHILTDRRPYREARPERRRTIPAGDILIGSERIEIRDYERRPALARAPQGVKRAATLLDALTMEPNDGYFRDLAVFLGFQLARSELDVAQEVGETEVAADILWRTALRAEYGGPVDARRAMEEAYRALAEALAQRAPPERIRQLLDALRRATDAYMQSLVQEAMRNGARETAEDTEEQVTLSGDDIDDLLRQVQEASDRGATLEAAMLLAMHAMIMQNLDVNLDQAQSEQGEQGEQGQQEMQQQMDELSEAIGEQRALNDETQEQSEQQSAQGGGGGEREGGQGGGGELAERQSQIRQSLGEAQEMSDAQGAAPSENLNAAQQAMRRAEGALQRGDFEGAQAAQNAALNHLREGADELAAQMREGGRESGRQGATGPRDPLGRTSSTGAGDGESNVPTEMDPARSREILDEIRRRAQDPNRPEAERDYLRRLLDRFSGS